MEQNAGDTDIAHCRYCDVAIILKYCPTLVEGFVYCMPMLSSSLTQVLSVGIYHLCTYVMTIVSPYSPATYRIVGSLSISGVGGV